MKVLNVEGKMNWIWTLIDDAKGVPPEARFSHSQDLYTPSRMLIIYGGMDDTNPKNRQTKYYHDVRP